MATATFPRWVYPSWKARLLFFALSLSLSLSLSSLSFGHAALFMLSFPFLSISLSLSLSLFLSLCACVLLRIYLSIFRHVWVPRLSLIVTVDTRFQQFFVSSFSTISRRRKMIDISRDSKRGRDLTFFRIAHFRFTLSFHKKKKERKEILYIMYRSLSLSLCILRYFLYIHFI